MKAIVTALIVTALYFVPFVAAAQTVTINTGGRTVTVKGGGQGVTVNTWNGAVNVRTGRAPRRQVNRNAWHTTTERDGITGQRNVITYAIATGGDAVLYGRCNRGQTDLFLMTFVRGEKLTTNLAVEFKVDDRPTWVGQFHPTAAEERRAIFAPEGLKIAFIRQLMTGQTAAIGYKPDGRIRKVVTFDLTGSHAALERVLNECDR